MKGMTRGETEVKRSSKSRENSEIQSSNNMNTLSDSLTEKEVQLIKEAAIKAGMSEAAATAAAEAASKVIVKEKTEAKEHAAKIAAESPPPKQPLLMMQEAGVIQTSTNNNDKDAKSNAANTTRPGTNNADWLAMWGQSLADMAEANKASNIKKDRLPQDRRYPTSSTSGGVDLIESSAARASEVARKRKAAAARDALKAPSQGKWPISKTNRKKGSHMPIKSNVKKIPEYGDFVPENQVSRKQKKSISPERRKASRPQYQSDEPDAASKQSGITAGIRGKHPAEQYQAERDAVSIGHINNGAHGGGYLSQRSEVSSDGEEARIGKHQSNFRKEHVTSNDTRNHNYSQYQQASVYAPPPYQQQEMSKPKMLPPDIDFHQPPEAKAAQAALQAAALPIEVKNLYGSSVAPSGRKKKAVSSYVSGQNQQIASVYGSKAAKPSKKKPLTNHHSSLYGSNYAPHFQPPKPVLIHQSLQQHKHQYQEEQQLSPQQHYLQQQQLKLQKQQLQQVGHYGLYQEPTSDLLIPVPAQSVSPRRSKNVEGSKESHSTKSSSEVELLAAMADVPKDRREYLLHMLAGMEEKLLGSSLELPPEEMAFIAQAAADVAQNVTTQSTIASVPSKTSQKIEEQPPAKPKSSKQKVAMPSTVLDIRGNEAKVSKPVATNRLLDKLGVALYNTKYGKKPSSSAAARMNPTSARSNKDLVNNNNLFDVVKNRVESMLHRDGRHSPAKPPLLLSNKRLEQRIFTDLGIHITPSESLLMLALLDPNNSSGNVGLDYWVLVCSFVYPAVLRRYGKQIKQREEAEVDSDNSDVDTDSFSKTVNNDTPPEASRRYSVNRRKSVDENKKDEFIAPPPSTVKNYVPFGPHRNKAREVKPTQEGTPPSPSQQDIPQKTYDNDDEDYQEGEHHHIGNWGSHLAAVEGSHGVISIAKINKSSSVIPKVARVASRLDPSKVPKRLRPFQDIPGKKKKSVVMGLYEFQATLEDMLDLNLSSGEIAQLVSAFSARNDKQIEWYEFVKWFWAAGKECNVSNRKREAQESFKRAYSQKEDSPKSPSAGMTSPTYSTHSRRSSDHGLKLDILDGGHDWEDDVPPPANITPVKYNRANPKEEDVLSKIGNINLAELKKQHMKLKASFIDSDDDEQDEPNSNHDDEEFDESNSVTERIDEKLRSSLEEDMLKQAEEAIRRHSKKMSPLKKSSPASLHGEACIVSTEYRKPNYNEIRKSTHKSVGAISEKEEQAIKRLQALFRISSAMKVLSIMKKKTKSAVKVQSMIRQKKAKREVEDKKAEQQQEVKAALKIQTVARQREAKAIATQKKEEQKSAIKLQGLARQRLAKKEIEERRHDVKKKERELMIAQEEIAALKAKLAMGDEKPSEKHAMFGEVNVIDDEYANEFEEVMGSSRSSHSFESSKDSKDESPPIIPNKFANLNHAATPPKGMNRPRSPYDHKLEQDEDESGDVEVAEPKWNISDDEYSDDEGSEGEGEAELHDHLSIISNVSSVVGEEHWAKETEHTQMHSIDPMDWGWGSEGASMSSDAKSGGGSGGVGFKIIGMENGSTLDLQNDSPFAEAKDALASHRSVRSLHSREASIPSSVESLNDSLPPTPPLESPRLELDLKGDNLPPPMEPKATILGANRKVTGFENPIPSARRSSASSSRSSRRSSAVYEDSKVSENPLIKSEGSPSSHYSSSKHSSVTNASPIKSPKRGSIDDYEDDFHDDDYEEDEEEEEEEEEEEIEELDESLEDIEIE